MENTPQASKTGPKDFFLWLGALVALYGSITFFIMLVFEYVNYAFPDPLAYTGDPYSGTLRLAMSGLIVFVPALIILMRLIRGSIAQEPGKAQIWVRRWAIMLTIFIALLSVIIDLITIINTFLGGEVSERLYLKALAVLVIAVGVFFHFFADFKGYWLTHHKQANLVGYAVGVLVLITIISGFFIVGTPNDIRLLRYDDQKVMDLQNIQYQVLNFWQTKERFPQTLAELADPLGGFIVPSDPQSGVSYGYEVTGGLSFKLCATFNADTPDTARKGSFETRPVPMGTDENWKHGTGETCFTRTIDPERYPPFKKTVN